MHKKIELLEIRRQSVHLIFGMLLATLLMLDIADKFFFVGITFIAGGLCVLSKKHRVPIYANFIDMFGREKGSSKSPEKGLFYFVLGSTFVVLLFPANIAIASILILAFGDSVSHIFGRHFGQFKTRFHKRKHVEGSIFGVIISTIAASFFVMPIHAFIASIVAMILEFPTIHIKGFRLDDNILVPLSAGISLYLLSLI